MLTMFKWALRVIAAMYCFMLATVYAAYQPNMRADLCLLVTLVNLGAIAYMIYVQGRDRGQQDVVDALAEKG